MERQNPQRSRSGEDLLRETAVVQEALARQVTYLSKTIDERFDRSDRRMDEIYEMLHGDRGLMYRVQAMEYKVQGAGALGKWLAGIGAVLLAGLLTWAAVEMLHTRDLMREYQRNPPATMGPRETR